MDKAPKENKLFVPEIYIISTVYIVITHTTITILILTLLIYTTYYRTNNSLQPKTLIST